MVTEIIVTGFLLQSNGYLLPMRAAIIGIDTGISMSISISFSRRCQAGLARLTHELISAARQQPRVNPVHRENLHENAHYEGKARQIVTGKMFALAKQQTQ